MERKEMIKQLGEHFGVKPKYLSVPSFAYEIRTADEVYTVDRHGDITRGDGESITVEEILNQQVQPEPLTDQGHNDEVAMDEVEPQDTNRDSETNQMVIFDGIEIELSLEGHTVRSLINIINMLNSKQRLLMMAFDTVQPFIHDGFAEELSKEKIKDDVHFQFVLASLGRNICPGFIINYRKGRLGFQLCCPVLTPEKIKAFEDLCFLMSEYAKTLNRASYKQAQEDNPKYALRTWLIRIGMKGLEYKETRKTLLKHLEGSGAFRKVDENDET